MSDSATAEAAGSASGLPPGAKGVFPPSEQAPRGGFLSDLLVELGFVEAKVVEDALATARQSGRSPEAVLLQSGRITEEQLARAVAERHGLDYVDLAAFEPDPGAAGLIGRATATRYGAVPIAFAGDALIVAVHDPVDGLAIDDIAVIAKSEVRVAVATREAIAEVVQRFVPEDAPPNRSEPEQGVAETEGSAAADVAAAEASTPAPEIFATATPPGASEGGDEDAARLLRELAEAKEALDAANAERDSVASDRDSVATERDAAAAERDALRTEVERQAGELERLAAERSTSASAGEEAAEAAGKKAAKLKAELEETAEERESLKSERNELKAELEELKAGLEKLTSERDGLRAEAESLRRETREVASPADAGPPPDVPSDLPGQLEAIGLAADRARETALRERSDAEEAAAGLRAKLEQLEGRNSELQERLAKLAAAADAARAATEEFAALQSELSGESERSPS